MLGPDNSLRQRERKAILRREQEELRLRRSKGDEGLKGNNLFLFKHDLNQSIICSSEQFLLNSIYIMKI